MPYNPAQARDPGGEGGGRWVKGGGTTATTAGHWKFADDEFRNDQDPVSAPDDWNLTDAERESAHRYTLSAFKTLNESLREGTEPSERDAEIIRDLDSAIAKAGELPEPATLWRGVDTGYVGIPSGPLSLLSREEREAQTLQGVADWAETKFPPGAEVELPAFQSTTSYVSPALRAAVSAKSPGIIFEIQARNGAPLSDLSGFDDEGELLLPRDSRFRVRKVLRSVEFVQSIDSSAWRTVVQLEQIK